MTSYHYSPKLKRPARCSNPAKCKYKDATHYDSLEAAQNDVFKHEAETNEVLPGPATQSVAQSRARYKATLPDGARVTLSPSQVEQLSRRASPEVGSSVRTALMMLDAPDAYYSRQYAKAAPEAAQASIDYAEAEATMASQSEAVMKLREREAQAKTEEARARYREQLNAKSEELNATALRFGEAKARVSMLRNKYTAMGQNYERDRRLYDSLSPAAKAHCVSHASPKAAAAVSDSNGEKLKSIRQKFDEGSPESLKAAAEELGSPYLKKWVGNYADYKAESQRAVRENVRLKRELGSAPTAQERREFAAKSHELRKRYERSQAGMRRLERHLVLMDLTVANAERYRADALHSRANEATAKL